MSRRFRVAAVAIVLAILAFYLWTAGTNGAALIFDLTYTPDTHVGVEVGRQNYGLYNVLADAFRAGRVDLLVPAAPEMSWLPDPYDSAANAPYRLHDASFYKGRYFLYFGPVPALVLFLPFSLVGIGNITEPLAVALFSFGAFVCAALVLLRLAADSERPISKPLLLVALAALGVSNAVPFLLRRPVVYEVAISSGAFFAMLGFCLLIRRWNDGKPSLAMLAIISLCWGLAVGCRPVHIILGLVLPVIWIVLVLQNTRTLRSVVTSGASLAVPFGACLLALGFYNYVRFDSWTEFGIRYQVGVPQPKGAWQLSNLMPGLFLNALHKPLLNYDFPFVHLLSPDPNALPPGYVASEVIGGFLVTTPVIWCLFASPIPRFAVWRDPRTALLISYGLALLLFEVLLFPAVTMRYQVDFIFPILTVALLVWLRIDSSLSAAWLKAPFRTLCLAAVIAGLMTHFAFGLRGYFDLFRRSHPRMYFALEDFSWPLSRLFASFTAPGSPQRLKVVAPAGQAPSPSSAEAYFVDSNGFYLRFFSPTAGQVRFAADLAPAPGALAPPEISLRVVVPGGIADEAIVTGETSIDRAIPVKPGINRVELHAGVRDGQASSGRSSVIVANPRLFDAATGQEIKAP
jgi:hypothetical protein